MNKIRKLTAILAALVIFFYPAFSNGADGVKVSQENKTKKFWLEPVTGMKLVWIEGGCFQMGQMRMETGLLLREVGVSEYDKYYADETPRHEVCVDGFWMGIHEVTQKEWKKVMEFNPSHFDEEWLQLIEPGPDIPESTQLLPVDSVSWEDTQKFIEKINKKSGEMILRLPTEAEWEYAARGGTTETMYFTGDTIGPEQANFNGSIPFGLNLRQDYRKRPVPTNSFPPNQYGLHDMHGNVWEWCNDWYGEKYYKNSPKKNPIGPERGSMRVLRGGSWFRYAGHIRSATRYKNRPTGQFGDTGFRLVRGSALRDKDDDPEIPVNLFSPDF